MPAQPDTVWYAPAAGHVPTIYYALYQDRSYLFNGYPRMVSRLEPACAACSHEADSYIPFDHPAE